MKRLWAQFAEQSNREGFEFSLTPMLSKAHVTALADADTGLTQGHNLMAFGPPEPARRTSSPLSATR